MYCGITSGFTNHLCFTTLSLLSFSILLFSFLWLLCLLYVFKKLWKSTFVKEMHTCSSFRIEHRKVLQQLLLFLKIVLWYYKRFDQSKYRYIINFFLCHTTLTVKFFYDSCYCCMYLNCHCFSNSSYGITSGLTIVHNTFFFMSHNFKFIVFFYSTYLKLK